MQLDLKIRLDFQALTYRFIRDERFVIEAENLRDIVEIGVLCNESPLSIVHPIVEVSDGNLHTQIFLIVHLHVPMQPNRAHMMCALQQWCIVFLWSVYSCSVSCFRVTPAQSQPTPKLATPIFKEIRHQ